jgi:phage terminase Nu1 subunit (DNA packaging protein)
MKASINQMTEWTGIDRRVVTRRLADLPHEDGPSRAKLYDVGEALRALYGNATDERLDPGQQRARLDKARADAAELDLAKKRGELIPVQDVIETWTTRVVRAKGRLLALPARLSPDLVRAPSQRDAERIIRAGVIQALRELSEQDIDGASQ